MESCALVLQCFVCINTLHCTTGQPGGLPAVQRTDCPRWRLPAQVLTVSPLHPLISSLDLCKSSV